MSIADQDAYSFAEVDDLGSYTQDVTYIKKHIQEILDLPLVDATLIRNASLKVVVDAVNSTEE